MIVLIWKLFVDNRLIKYVHKQKSNNSYSIYISSINRIDEGYKELSSNTIVTDNQGVMHWFWHILVFIESSRWKGSDQVADMI